ncbi:unnamed protein product [Parnassius apollo]|uniref:(apollo) hypothetical protein n=1 Tax=Parnassius apollo TaxID=110799 RepID=A0A8S3XYM9_PARAO|nr:unnamed protein product [Parnassius apollo]
MRKSVRCMPSPNGDKKGASNRTTNYVYVNSAFIGSLNSVNDTRAPQAPTSVIREQYWTCSKWSFAQKVMAIAVGVLSGAVIGLALTVALRKGDTDLIGGLFRSQPAPD